MKFCDTEILWYNAVGGGTFLPCLWLFEVEAITNIVQGLIMPPTTVQ